MRKSHSIAGVAVVAALFTALLSAAPEAPLQVGCLPVSQRTSEVGCWVTASSPLGKVSASQVFWFIDSYPSRVAADAAKTQQSTVVESLGKVWLFTIAGADPKPARGTRVASVGPLEIRAGTEYTAQYMEAIFTPGMTSSVHRHAGPEAWYTLAGETCLETPDGKVTGRAGGQHVVVPHGPPMHLTATGTETRRALVLILHESSQPATSAAPDWSPKGLCRE